MNGLLPASAVVSPGTQAQAHPRALHVCLPLRELHITAPFGLRTHPLKSHMHLHRGVDLRADRDTVWCVLDGVVTHAAMLGGLGLAVRVRHGVVESTYGHLSARFVSKGDTVAAGRPIGITGATGIATAEHLHFAIRHRATYVNPLAFLLALAKQTKQEE